MSYQGHKDWGHWNVSLWMFNDVSLYNMAVRIASESDSYNAAARWYYETLQLMEMPKTPDGAEYTVERIEAAMETGELTLASDEE